MWRAVIADDEGVILNGLKKLIDWEGCGVEIAGDARDGGQLKGLIEEKKPDIVITDIMMPKMTGLELLKWDQDRDARTKFIFISGYQEFSYAQEAIRNGAVDYLLKPVGKKELEEAVKKAIHMLEDQNTAEIFREDKSELRDILDGMSDRDSYGDEELYRLSRSVDLSFEDCFFAGLCIGIHPDDAAALSEKSYAHFNLIRFSVYNRIVEMIRVRRKGFLVEKDGEALHMIGAFRKGEEATFEQAFIQPLCRTIGEECHVRLCAGIGLPTDKADQLKNTYKTAKFAFELYFFEERQIINFQEIHRDYTVTYDDYAESFEQAFRAIITKDAAVLDKIDRVMDRIEAIHYGNKYAVQTRVMNFTGDLASRLYHYHLLGEDFYQMQDELQAKVVRQTTFRALRACIRTHYEELIRRVYAAGRFQDKALIEEVKDYIRAHYAKDLSIRELADVACVSANYFSAMFKRETGQNYKAYLTGIRMEKALELLRTTDDKTYEIGEKVGYNNVRRFVEAFKQNYSVTPMEYKKSLREEQ